MSSQFVNYVNDSNATNLLNTCTTDVPATSQTVEPKCYLVTFQQVCRLRNNDSTVVYI